MRSRKQWPAATVFWSLALAVLTADLVVKRLIYDGQVTSRETEIVPGVFFCLEPARNLGIAWGLFSRWPQLIAISRIIAVSALVVYFLKYSSRGRIETLALGGILGGALGNLYDSIFLGFVRDFFAFRIVNYRWPNFNIADSFVSVGAAFLIGYMLFGVRGEDPRRGSAGETSKT